MMGAKKQSKSTRNGSVSTKLKLSNRRFSQGEARFRGRMIYVELKKILHAVRSLERSTLTSSCKLTELCKFLMCDQIVSSDFHGSYFWRSLLSQAKSSEQRRLELHFDCKLPTELYTSDMIYADGTQAKPLVTVVLRDENMEIINEGPLSLLKIVIFVVHGDFKAEESEDWTEKQLKRSIVCEREGKKPLLAGSCVITMENGVGSFSEIMFTDNSSWVPSKKFRLGAKVAEGVPLPGLVGIRPAVSGAFRVKDQRGKNYEKRPVPSLDDAVWRLEKIARNGLHHRRLEENQIYTVKDFLQKYHMNQSSLREILGVKQKAWEAIVQHATTCSPSDDHFLYDTKTGFELVFDCVYSLVGVSHNHENYRPLDTLDDNEKNQAEKVKRFAFEDQSKLVLTNCPAEWRSPKINPHTAPCPDPHHLAVPAHEGQSVNSVFLVEVPPDPQNSLLDSNARYHQPEESTTERITEDISPILRSDSLKRDSLIIGNDNQRPMPNLNLELHLCEHAHT